MSETLSLVHRDGLHPGVLSDTEVAALALTSVLRRASSISEEDNDDRPNTPEQLPQRKLSSTVRVARSSPGTTPSCSEAVEEEEKQASATDESQATKPTLSREEHGEVSGKPAASNEDEPERIPTDRDSSSQQEAERKQKDEFLIFTRVLMMYLEERDPALLRKVRAIIKDCSEKNRAKEPGYESVTDAMRSRLKEVVSEQYWKRAEVYLRHVLAPQSETASRKRRGSCKKRCRRPAASPEQQNTDGATESPAASDTEDCGERCANARCLQDDKDKVPADSLQLILPELFRMSKTKDYRHARAARFAWETLFFEDHPQHKMFVKFIPSAYGPTEFPENISPPATFDFTRSAVAAAHFVEFTEEAGAVRR